MAFRKNHPNVKFDIEMREHPQKVVLMYSNDENPHLHSDPKEVFIKKQALVTGAFYYIYFRGRDNEKV